MVEVDWVSFFFGAVTAIAVGGIALFSVAFGALKRQNLSGRGVKK